MEEMEIEIPLFDGEDYSMWKMRITMLLTLKKCEDVIKREKQAADGKDWDERDLKAINFIYSTISNKQLEFVCEEISAYKMIKKLDEKYLKESTAWQTLCRNKLEKMGLDKYTDSATFCSEFIKATNDLIDAGVEVSEKEILNYMLNMLPSQYNCISDLIDYLNKNNGEHDERRSNAFAAKKYQQGSCYKGGKIGHFVRECQDSGQAGRNNDNPVTWQGTTRGTGYYGRERSNSRGQQGTGLNEQSGPGPSAWVPSHSGDNSETNRLLELKNEAAKKLYLAKEYKKALKEYSDLIELCPNEFRHYGNRAACYMMTNKYSDALNDSRKSLELNPRFHKSHVRMAKCHLILGSIEAAEAIITVLKFLDPSNTEIPTLTSQVTHLQNYIKEGDAAYALKDFRKVVYCMDRCCDVATSCPKFKLMKAECLVFLGRYLEAQEIANNISHIDNLNLDAMYVRAICFYYQGNIENAFARFQQVLRLAPDHSKVMEIYKRARDLKKKKEEGNIAYKTNQFHKAYALYTEALTIDPQNIEMNAKLHFNKATAAAKCGLLQETIAECTEALKLDESYLKALLRRASTYMTLMEYEKAVYDLEKVCILCNIREHKRLLMEAQFALNRSKKKDYYKILGINKTASTDDIKKAYKKRVMVHHPDRHMTATEGERKEQEKMFKEVGEAYGILSDPKKRSRYDNEHDINEYNRYDKDNDTTKFRYQDSPFWRS